MDLDLNRIHSSIWDWLINGDNGIIELSFISASYDESGNKENDSRIVYTPNTIGNSAVLENYMRHKLMQYTFTIKQYSPVTAQSNTATNISVLKIFEDVANWVQAQIDDGNLPVFPEGCEITKIDINPGTVSGVDAQGAEFQQIIQVEYFKKEN